MFKVSPFDFKPAFQNIDIIWVLLLKESCRTLNLEQLLFLEILELLYKFGSNLGFKSSGNFVIIVNSHHGGQLTIGELLFRYGRRRGPLRLHTSMEKAPAWLLFASWSRL